VRGTRARADPDADELSGRVSTITGKAPPAGKARSTGHGTPAEVAADLMRYREAADVEDFQINFHGNRNLEQLIDSIECFMRQVKPRVT
jgi:hypothetical protein